MLTLSQVSLRTDAPSHLSAALQSLLRPEPKPTSRLLPLSQGQQVWGQRSLNSRVFRARTAASTCRLRLVYVSRRSQGDSGSQAGREWQDVRAGAGTETIQAGRRLAGSWGLCRLLFSLSSRGQEEADILAPTPFCFQSTPSSSSMNTSSLPRKASFLTNKGRQTESSGSGPCAGTHPLWWCCVCVCLHPPEVGESETPSPLHRTGPSLLRARPGSLLPPCWTGAHPHVPSHPQDNLPSAGQLQWAQFSSFPFLKGWATSSHSSALDHNFLLSPQKLYFLPGVLLTSSFHPSKSNPSLLINQREEGAHP